jgi:hypothetical protein
MSSLCLRMSIDPVLETKKKKKKGLWIKEQKMMVLE